jgi:hypothetical protein
MTNNERTLGCDANREAGPSDESTNLGRPAMNDSNGVERAIEVEPGARLPDRGDAHSTSALMQLMTCRSHHPSIVEVAIFDLLHHLHLAVNLVRAACERQPQHQARLRQAFGVLPWYLPMRVTDDVYTAHVNEQLERVVTDQSVSEGTRAEVLAVLSVWSNSLDESCVALYAQLARDLLGVEMKFENDQRPRESSPGASAQQLGTLRRRLLVTDRIVQIKEK